MEKQWTKKTPPRLFSKMHEKVQNKYEEMQKKIERSKSMDALHVMSDDNKTKSASLHSVHNVSDFDSHPVKKERSSSIGSVIIEEISQKCADVGDKIENLVTNEDTFSDHNEIQDDDISVFSFSNISLESLNESYGSESDLAISPKSPPRVRLRDRLAAARERKRKRKEEEKREKDEKRRNSEVDKYVFSNNNTKENRLSRLSKRIRTATVTIALINAKGFNVRNDEKLNLFYCKFRLGLDKYKSKLAKCEPEIHVAKWLELFSLNIYEDFMLEITLWSKDKQDNFIGRKVIDLSQTESEKTHRMTLKLHGESDTELFILLTISGMFLLNTIMDLNDYQFTQDSMDNMKQKFAWYHLAEDYSDVGYLSVLVYGAKGLSVNDAFCVLELGNDRRQTHTETKTNNPSWMKFFNFTVTDITSILEVSVYDENKKFEPVGQISIPLLSAENGIKKCYALKDKTQRERAKGNCPRIFLEIRVNWHPIKASIRVINPKEVKYLKTEAKFDRRLFVSNVMRCKAIVSWILDAIKWTKTIFEWESQKQSFVALIIWLTLCWVFKTWMLPILLLIPFFWFRPQKYRFKGEEQFYHIIKKELFDIDEEVLIELNKPDKEEKKTLRERLTTVQEITQMVQNGLGKVASIGESVKNLVNFTVPFLSFLAIFIILAITFVIYLIPVKYIFMAWGINKFTRKIRRPNRIPNNEILDLLSRVPDDEMLLDCEEFHIDETEDC